MAEGETNFRDDAEQMNTPPETNGNEFKVAQDLQQQYDIHSGDITATENQKQKMRGTGGEPEQVQPGADNVISIDHYRARQKGLQDNAKAEAQISSDKNEVKGNLISGAKMRLLQKIPGVGAILAKFKSSDLQGKIKTLRKLQRKLKIAKTMAAIADGVRLWVEIFLATAATVIIPIFLILLIPFWLLVYFLFQDKVPGATFAKIVATSLKSINVSLNAFLKAANQENNKKQTLAALRNQQMQSLAAANEPMSSSKAA